MKLVSHHRIPVNASGYGLPAGPETCTIDLIQFLEVLRRQMVHNIEAVWQETADGGLIITFPQTAEMAITIEAGAWHRDTPTPTRLGSHLRLVR